MTKRAMLIINSNLDAYDLKKFLERTVEYYKEGYHTENVQVSFETVFNIIESISKSD